MPDPDPELCWVEPEAVDFGRNPGRLMPVERKDSHAQFDPWSHRSGMRSVSRPDAAGSSFDHSE